uniref:Protein kinase domain-containing protein n=1 Tax=Araucaria cunninghamii TaxID=56994 RepID=A0A0D6QUH1_ARACU
MEYVDCQTLDQLLHGEERNCSLSWETRIKIAQGTARALTYLHEGCRVRSNGPLIHGNLNPRNIFVDMDDQEPLLSDFGIAFRTQHSSDSSSSVFQQLQEYAPPDFKRSLPMTTKSDVFSYGMVLLELLTLKRPTSENVSGDMAGWVRDKIHDSYGEVLDPAIFATATTSRKKKIKRVLGLALMCTRDDPETRPSMKEVLEMLIQMKGFRIEGNAVVPTTSEVEEV